MTGNSKAWLGGFGELGHPYSYTHPTTKQCNYSYTHPSSKQCNYSYTHPSTKQCDAAAGNHNHTLNNLNGTLSVAKGGTGVTSLDALKSALGVSSGGGKVYYTTLSSSGGTISPGFAPLAIFICVYGSNGVNGRFGFSIKPSPRMLFHDDTNTSIVNMSWNSSSVTVGSGYHYNVGCVVIGT